VTPGIDDDRPTDPAPPPSAAWYAFWADVTALTHTLFVGFVVWGELLILTGALLGWQWVHNLPFRAVHLGLVGYVGVQDLLGYICPLTTWERDLRLLCGQSASNKSFVGRLVHTLLMCELNERTLRTIRLSFAAVVVLTFVLLPPYFGSAAT
jgi:hypothetical protein